MASKSLKRDRLIGKRVRSLAIVYLTARDDVVIDETDPDPGLDLMVRITAPKNGGIRKFGVALRGAWASVSETGANEAVRPVLRELKRRGPFPFPVCLFFFTMEETQGWFAWFAEPVTGPDERPALRMHEAPTCQRLEKKTLNSLVDQVNCWYDAFYSNLIGEGANGKKP
jgi:hypothetical protein